jgi:hypothetical protein
VVALREADPRVAGRRQLLLGLDALRDDARAEVGALSVISRNVPGSWRNSGSSGWTSHFSESSAGCTFRKSGWDVHLVVANWRR